MKHFAAVLLVLVPLTTGCGDNVLEAQPDASVAEAPGQPGDNPDDVGGPPDEPAGDDDSGLACTPDELLPIFECALENCLLGGFDPGDFDPGDFDPENPGDFPFPGGGGDFPIPGGGGFDLGEILACAGTSCLSEILSVSPDCMQCILGGLSGDPADLADVCGDFGGGGIPDLPGLPGDGGDQGGEGPGGLPF